RSSGAILFGQYAPRHPDEAGYRSRLGERGFIATRTEIRWHEVGKGMAVEGVEVGLQSASENRFQLAGAAQVAGGDALAEAFDQPEVGLGAAHDVPDANIAWIAGQAQATAAPTRRRDQPAPGEIVDDLHQVVPRKSEVIREV